jgi:hypothetical protein
MRAVCAFADGTCSGRPTKHHFLSQSRIKRQYRHFASLTDAERARVTIPPAFERKLRELLDDARNLGLICVRHHQLLENKRIRWWPPASAVEFARELGMEHVFDKARERAA